MIITKQVEQVERVERNDVYSIWELQDAVGENDEVIKVKVKVRDTTLDQVLMQEKDIENQMSRLQSELIKIQEIKQMILGLQSE